MHLLLLAFSLQVRTVALGLPVQPPASADAIADSIRDARRARNEQASFERARRAYLPSGPGGGGRCDVHVGRFCWWADETRPDLPPEAPSVVARRYLLVSLFDSLAAVHPGDDWMVGMAVHYRVEAHQLAGADSAARACRGTPWWCAALTGYAAQARGAIAVADSAFAAALVAMPAEQRCRWTDIRTLLPGDARDRYEKLGCEDRAAMEVRYWSLARPRLAAPANDWRTEFLTRRVQAWLAQRSLTPQALSWSDDSEELLLRFGWPVSWSRVDRPYATMTPEISVVGYDPWPSWDFGPREELLDSLTAAGDEGWELRAQQSTSRYGPVGVERVIGAASQLARFRRADSTLIVAAFLVRDDSVRSPDARLAASLSDGSTRVSTPDSTLSGTVTLTLPGAPALAGVEITDTVSHSLARNRTLYSSVPASSGAALSDLLLYRGGGDPPEQLDSALARAYPGLRVVRGEPIGVFWEAYHPDAQNDSTEVSLTVERVDHGLLRSAFQRVGLADQDSPLKMHWSDARPVVGGTSTYAVSLDLSNLSAGRYRITLAVANAGGGQTPSTTFREFELAEH
jgi:hypothetical protein